MKENPKLSSGDTAEGHRKRLREKFIESSLTGFHDYEIIELLLTLGSIRKDCKQQAKESVVGAGGIEHFRFKMLKTGETEITMIHKRQWEEEVLDQKIFTIDIK